MAPSVTNWWRLEAHARDPRLSDALEARLADPLWMLGRQWQTGEFQASDGGTPVNARARISVRTLGLYRPGGPGGAAAAQPFDVAAAPLELLVEAEPAPANLRLAISGGRQWLRLLAGDSGLLSSWLKAGYGIDAAQTGPTPDEDAERLAAATGGRALDGRAIYAALAAAAEAGDFSGLPGSAATVEKAARLYIAWWQARLGRAPTASAWQDSRMEYEFAVATSTGDETVFTARDYGGGGIDWPAFDVDVAASMRNGGPAPDAEKVVAVALPSPVAFKGMPFARWWEFEDATVSFPRIDAATDDLARLFAVEFALIYGNDFFVIPVRLPVGTVSRVDSLVVEDSFGWSFLIGSTEAVDGPGSKWHVFKPALDSRGAGGDPLPELLLPATTAGRLDGEPLEDVLIARDDVAALAWGIEHVVPGAGGRPLDRAQAAAERRRRADIVADPPLPPTGRLQYRLATELPEYWYPLLPKQIGLRAIAFELGEAQLGPNPTRLPLGSVLGGNTPMTIQEEELYRAGMRVRRLARRVRWSDGSIRLWLGRRTGPGRGESGSGLRFDSADVNR
jgi:hypothetical protein